MSSHAGPGQAAAGTHAISLPIKGLVAAAMFASSASLSLTITLYLLGRANPVQATGSWLAILSACFLALAWQQAGHWRSLLRLPARRRDAALSASLALHAAVLLATLLVNAGYYLSDDVNFKYMGNWSIRTALALLITGLLFTVLEAQRALLTIQPRGEAANPVTGPGRRNSPAGIAKPAFAGSVGAGVPAGPLGALHGLLGGHGVPPLQASGAVGAGVPAGPGPQRRSGFWRGRRLCRPRSAEADLAIPADGFDRAERSPEGPPGGDSLVETLRSQAGARAPWVLLAVAAVVGLLEATSFVTALGDDYARYWTIADALSGGWGYPASEVGDIYQRGGMSGYLVDLPALPLAMMVSFALLGHTVLAAMAPTLVVTAFFPLAAYLAFRELTGHSLLSFVAALALGMFPLLSFYVVRSAEPDGIFITLLMTLAFLAMRNDHRPEGLVGWAALGLVAGIIALTRPEGIMFAGTTFLTLALCHIARRGFWLGGAVCGLMVASFSVVMLLTFGKPWPTSFMGAVKLEHIAQNLDGFLVWSLPRYSESLGMPVPVLALAGVLLALLYAVGAWQITRQRPQLLFLVLLPAMSLISFLLVSPMLTRPPFPYDFFRRASYGLPFLALVAAHPLAAALRRVSAVQKRLVLCSALVALSVPLIAYEAKVEATPEAIYEGGTKILTSGSYVMATDLIAHPRDLPRMPFERVEGVLLVAKSFDYMAFRNDLTAFFKPMDLHGVDRAASYPRACLLLFLIGLFYAILGDGSYRPARQRRKQCPAT